MAGISFISRSDFLSFLYVHWRNVTVHLLILPEAENELNFGYHQEYSSMKLGFYLFAEYINMFISGVVMSTLYFGGYDIPFVNEATWGMESKRDGHYWICGVDEQSILFRICVYVDTLDHSTFPF